MAEKTVVTYKGEEWFTDLHDVEAGDEIVLSTRRGRTSLWKVSRVTKAQIIFTYGSDGEYEKRFWKKNGEEVGADQWSDSVACRHVDWEVRKALREQGIESGNMLWMSPSTYRAREAEDNARKARRHMLRQIESKLERSGRFMANGLSEEDIREAARLLGVELDS